MDKPYYYSLESKTYSNSFRISGFVLDLVDDNDSISKAINSLKEGDTIIIGIDSTELTALNNPANTINIIGLTTKGKVVIDTEYLEKYQRRNIYNTIFGILFGGTILFFVIRSQRRTEDDNPTEH